jgi:RHS repeat-associated protein
VNDTISSTYNELGDIASRGLVGFTSTFAYDALGRIGAQGTPLGNFIRTFDGRTARPLTLTYPNSQVTQYAYFPNSGDHRLQEIKHLAPGGAVLSKFNYTYDAGGKVQTRTQQLVPDPAKIYEVGYDAADQLATATLKSTDPTPVTLKRYGYAYDPAGNRIAEQVDDTVTSWTPNNRNQVTSRQAGGALFFRGTVNEAASVSVQGRPAHVTPDNRFEGAAQVPSGTSTATVVAQDYAQPPNIRTNTYEINVSGGGTTYTYDLNGNLTGDGTKTYEWDAENRLVRVLQGATELARFVYDGDGRRTQKIANGVTRTYVYDGEDIIEERVAPGQTIRHVLGLAIDQHLASHDGANVSYYLTDHLGSAAQVTNGAGTVTLAREYDPWGNLLAGASASGWAFTGREWDHEIGLYYYRARYYDPAVGHFISEDPIGVRGGLNLYRYVGNDPLNFFDPLGLAGLKRVPCPGTAQNLSGLPFGGGALAFVCCSGGQFAACYDPSVTPPNNSRCVFAHEAEHIRRQRERTRQWRSYVERRIGRALPCDKECDAPPCTLAPMNIPEGEHCDMFYADYLCVLNNPQTPEPARRSIITRGALCFTRLERSGP